MCGVLIDDDEAVARLRHDIGFVDLRPRRAERMIERFGRRCRSAARHFGFGRTAQISRRHPTSNSGLRRFGEPGAAQEDA